MKVLVTGGAGFIGSHIVDQLLEKGHEVVIIDNMSSGKETNLNPKAAFYRIDMEDAKIQEVFQREKPKTVIHQAAQTVVQTSVRQPVYDAHMNILGTINLLEAARLYGTKKFVYASSAAVYGDPQYVPIDERHPVGPLSGYGISKYTPEQYLRVYQQMYGMEFTILRYANVYGIRQDPQGEGGVISIFIDKVLAESPFTIFGNGEQTRDYIYVEDVAKANLAALKAGNNEVFNIGTGVHTTLNQLVEKLQQISGKALETIYEKERLGDIKHSYFTVNKAKNNLHWTPEVSLDEGLRKTYQYYSLQNSTKIL
ncbi:GDP-mannose 4,6-dehydratase [Shimazuella sp. AN120528]|uniref:NAD-dependent epimerase/dehydratase family protein n=1 Tax=Shimazuella soli TaxID=1892854 RepID=UPI001F0E1A86|nr:NAD-dependent epimerase/dehydratase family protein [Shimazuella soli]MCH5585276.1 GDP-mannose 4,6-dehydratase [Shimazuella soli]